MQADVMIIGGGLAGSEAAWQAARRGARVSLWEMRPGQMTPAHFTGQLGELVCSNSLRARSLTNAAGLLKEELKRLDSLIMSCAEQSEVPAGGALAVDREMFSRMITERIEEHPLIEVNRDEVKEIPEFRPLVISSGPLTSNTLAEEIRRRTGEDYLYFYDAAAPIVTSESINYEIVFKSSRYDRESEDYINCPMNREQYEAFWNELVQAERFIPHHFEKEKFFEGCVPIEELASRGSNTLLFGPLKPVGLIDPRFEQQPYAVVQLRPDNMECTLYNMVGFQTRLKWPEQRRVFQMIPGLERAEFVRYGMMHRNTFINAPRLLNSAYELLRIPGVFVAGQLSGVEGYIESTASGLVAGINAVARSKGVQELVFPPETAVGALSNYITSARPESFQPMNINFGMFPPVSKKMPKQKRREEVARRSLETLELFLKNSLCSLA